jgi:4-alpha-glucanotransferase
LGVGSLSVSELRLLNELAGLYGIEAAFRKVPGHQNQVSADSLTAVLKILGAPLESMQDIRSAIRQRKLELLQRLLEPVTVCRSTNPAVLTLRLPETKSDLKAEACLETEDGRLLNWTLDLSILPVSKTETAEGAVYTVKKYTLPDCLPWGYHIFNLNLQGQSYTTLIICAPYQAFSLDLKKNERLWGLFIPLYALNSSRSWGAGDLTDLEFLLNWVGELGGHLTGTLPLLSTFLDKPFSPSPYTPVSRLFWSEFYLDITRLEELKADNQARELLNSTLFKEELDKLRSRPLVDYFRVMSAKRKVLEHLAAGFFLKEDRRREEFRGWLKENQTVSDYARFRACTEKMDCGWPLWPPRLREGVIREGDYETSAEQYHLYVQWAIAGQFKELSDRARNLGQKLYLDYPLGVHCSGYDVWREHNVFVLDAGVGAPPDMFYSQGQNWGFPPLHPEKIRQQGYKYYLSGLRHHLKHAGILRLDHVAGLQRLFWIPKGMTANNGVYVKYKADEFYAVLTLESQRYRSVIIGEDLGNVPGYIRKQMSKHKIYRMYVASLEYRPDPRRAIGLIPEKTLASLNTHDLPPFTAFWQEKEKNVADRICLPMYLYQQGWLPSPTLNNREVLEGCLKHLAASRAELFLINLEDLWQETNSQNMPGDPNHPNWSRKARFPIEAFTKNTDLITLLKEIRQLRESPPGRPRK